MRHFRRRCCLSTFVVVVVVAGEVSTMWLLLFLLLLSLSLLTIHLLARLWVSSDAFSRCPCHRPSNSIDRVVVDHGDVDEGVIGGGG